MYVVVLSYLVELDLIDQALPAHVEWLTQWYEKRVFIASGPQVPREGGVILVADIPRSELDALLAADPFAERRYVSYAITRFEPTTVASRVSLEP